MQYIRLKKLADVIEENSRSQITLTLVYDALYAQGEAVLAKHNPCNFQVEMVSGRRMTTCTRGLPCCGDCKFLGPEGCTVKALGCKLALCGAAAVKYPEAKAALSALADTAKAMDIPIHYAENMGYYPA